MGLVAGWPASAVGGRGGCTRGGVPASGITGSPEQKLQGKTIWVDIVHPAEKV